MKKNAWAILWIALVIIITFTTNMWAKGSPMFNSTPAAKAVTSTSQAGGAQQSLSPSAKLKMTSEDAKKKLQVAVAKAAAAAKSAAAESLSKTAEPTSFNIGATRLKIGIDVPVEVVYNNPTLEKGWQLDNSQDDLSRLFSPSIEVEKWLIGVKISPMPRLNTTEISYYGAPMGEVSYYTLDLAQLSLHSPVPFAGARFYIGATIQYNWINESDFKMGGYKFNTSVEPYTTRLDAGAEIEISKSWLCGIDASIVDAGLKGTVPYPGTTIGQGPVVTLGANFKWQVSSPSSHK